MSWPDVYVLFPGNAREALGFYQSVFGGELQLFSYAEFGRTDGPTDAIAHGQLTGRVSINASDAGPDEDAVHMTGVMLTILGAEPNLERAWFAALAEGGRVLDDLQRRPWGDFDGQVVDQFGVRWLIGFKGDAPGA